MPWLSSGSLQTCFHVLACRQSRVLERAVQERAAKAAFAGAQALRPLTFPVAQLLAGAARLVPTSRYLPLRLRLLRALVGLGRATRLDVPAVPLLLELLQWSALGKGLRPAASGAAGAGSGAASGGGLLLRASKALLASPAYQQDVLEQARPLSGTWRSTSALCATAPGLGLQLGRAANMCSAA